MLELEYLIINQPSLSHHNDDQFMQIMQLIKTLGMELQRFKPTEWNEFITVCCMGSSSNSRIQNTEL